MLADYIQRHFLYRDCNIIDEPNLWRWIDVFMGFPYYARSYALAIVIQLFSHMVMTMHAILMKVMAAKGLAYDENRVDYVLIRRGFLEFGL